MTHNYSDIINLPRHISKKHPSMDINNRAAQFAPYAAIVGHKEIITQNENLAAQKTNINHEIDIIPNDEP